MSWRFRNILVGSTVMIVGNGYSLDQTPLDEFSKKYVTMGMNHIYKKPFSPTYYAYVDFDLEEHLPFPREFTPNEIFVRAELAYKIPGSHPIYPIVMPPTDFSIDINNCVVFGGSTTNVLLQIAFYMGVKTVLLVGIDHHYPVAGNGKSGVHFLAGDKDPDHFGENYYVPGRRYTRPSLEAVEQYYKTANEVYKKNGKRIVNLTPDTHLEIFDKDKIENWI